MLPGNRHIRGKTAVVSRKCGSGCPGQPGTSILTRTIADASHDTQEYRPSSYSLSEWKTTPGSGSRPTLDANGKLLATGAVLLGVGGAVLMTGAALASVALAQAAKKWIDQLEESPAVMAQRHLQHLKVAAEAGSRAWRDQSVRGR